MTRPQHALADGDTPRELGARLRAAAAEVVP
jgi:hypothetical protein